MTDTDDIADRLAETIARSGRSQREISLAAGLNPGAINDFLKNRGRSPTVANLKKIARALGVSASYLIDGTRTNTTADGMNESRAAPWAPKPTGERPDHADALRKLPATLAPMARQPATYQLDRGIPGFGLLSKDILVVDLSKRAKDGDIVVANVVDLATGAGHSVVRKLLSPYLVSGDPEEPEQVLLADGTRTAVMGVMVASFRAPQLTATP